MTGKYSWRDILCTFSKLKSLLNEGSGVEETSLGQDRSHLLTTFDTWLPLDDPGLEMSQRGMRQLLVNQRD